MGGAAQYFLLPRGGVTEIEKHWFNFTMPCTLRMYCNVLYIAKFNHVGVKTSMQHVHLIF